MTRSLDALLARYAALSPHLRHDWAHWSTGPEDNAHTLFCALTSHVRDLLAAENLAVVEAIFAEAERSMRSADPDESNAAAVCFLENFSNASPEVYARILPLLGPESLRFLRAWEEDLGEAAPLMSVAEAHALVVEPLSAACPAYVQAYRRALPEIVTRDGETTAFGLARVAFDVFCDASVEEAAPLLAVVEPFLLTGRRSLREAFQRCFLDQLGELPAAWIAAREPLPGPAACAHRAKTACRRPRVAPWYFEDLLPHLGAPNPAAEAILARYVAISPSLRREWDEIRRDDRARKSTVFWALAIHVRRLFEIGQHANLPAIFAEIDRSLRSEDEDERDAAGFAFLEDLLGDSPSSYAQIVPLLGPESLAYLRSIASRGSQS